MIDSFDCALLNLVQKDDSRTSDELAKSVALSPSAIARRLRRLRKDGWITRSIALLGEKLVERRMRAIVLLQLSEHADQSGKTLLLQRIRAAAQIQFCYELAGSWDLLLLFDCATMCWSRTRPSAATKPASLNARRSSSHSSTSCQRDRWAPANDE